MNLNLDNPVYDALLTGNASMALGNGGVKFFHPDVSPFAGFDTENENGFNELYAQLPAKRTILFASRLPVVYPHGWTVKHDIPGSQFIFPFTQLFPDDFKDVAELGKEYADEMVALAALTRPGPFSTRTIEFGNYHGIFQDGKLVAMTGRRLHINDCMELSAVCTHPGYTGKGYAQKLLKQQVNSILTEGMFPFLHVRADNAGAIAVYEKLGFIYNGPMHFYFMQRDD